MEGEPTRPGTQDPQDRLESLFHQALEATPQERTRLMEDLSRSEPEMARELQTLLRYHDTEADTIEDLRSRFQAWSAETSKAAAPDKPLEGRVVGPYRIRALLGRGGMGAVYRAERVQGPFEQEVALKVLPLGVDSRAARIRFDRERQILARLKHPAIAQIYDGGVTDDGTPWFAMELVDGAPVDQYCDTRRMGLAERIRLFLQVCQAVAHAHGRLVLHRDLKPGNVLVTDDGDVKLLDFGVARLLADDEETSAATRLGVPATPAYASPEQLRGESVGVASDVYSLGAVLYRLVTGVGVRERDTTEATVTANRGRVVSPDRAFWATESDRDALAAARSIDPPALRKILSGDLKWILFRALEPDGEARYTTVAEFHDDLVRYLDRRPVRAHPDSRGYRLRRWAQRNWGAVAAAVLLVLGTGAATTGWLRAVQAEARARAETARSQAVSSFLEGIFQMAVTDPQAVRNISAADVLAQGVDEARLTLGGVPDAQALVLESLGVAYEGLGLPVKSDSVLALAMEVADAELEPDDPARARIRTRRALLALFGGDAGQAEELVSEASSLVQAAPSSDGSLRGEVAWARGELHFARGEYDAARSAYLEAVDGARRSAGGAWVPPAYLASLGRLARVVGDLDEAEARYREALELARDSLPRTATPYGYALDGLASVFFEDQRSDRREEALALRREALADVEARLGPDHPRMVGFLNNAGAASHVMGRMDEAVDYYRRALAIAEAEPEQPTQVLRLLGNIGVAERLRARPADAEAALRDAISRNADASPGPNRSLLAKHWTDLGLVLWEANRFNEARSALDQGLRLNEAEFGPDSPQTSYTVYQLLLLSGFQGRYVEVLEHGRRLIPFFEATGNRAGLVSIHQEMADAHLMLGAVDSARVHVDLGTPGENGSTALADWVWTAAAVADAEGRRAVADSLRDQGVVLAAEAPVEMSPSSVAYAESRRAAARDSLSTALGHLERAARLGLTSLRARRDPELVPLRGHPRFEAAMRGIRERLGLEG